MVGQDITRDELLAELVAAINPEIVIPANWFTLEEIAKQMGLSESHMRHKVYTQIKAGVLVRERVGAHIYYHLKDAIQALK